MKLKIINSKKKKKKQATNEWAKINAKGILPKGRHFHTVVKYQHSLWIFGGKSNGYQNDFFEFDLVTHTWSNVVFNGRPPSARFGKKTLSLYHLIILLQTKKDIVQIFMQEKCIFLVVMIL